MYASKLHHTQIDKFHHIARLGVYAILILSVIAMTISLNRPETSVGGSGARAENASNCGTFGQGGGCPSDCIYVTKQGCGPGGSSPDFAGCWFKNSSGGYDVGSFCEWAKEHPMGTFGYAYKTPTPKPATSTPTPTPTPPPATTTKISCQSLTVDKPTIAPNESAVFTLTLNNVPTSAQAVVGIEPLLNAFVNNIFTSEPIAMSRNNNIFKKSLAYNEIKQIANSASKVQFNAQVKTDNVEQDLLESRAPGCVAIVDLVDAPVASTSIPKLESYSVSSEGGTVSADGHTLTIQKSHTKNIIVKATTSNPGKKDNVLEKGKLNIYKKVDPVQADILTKQDEYIVVPTAEGNNATFTWTFPMPAGQETDFQANFYPGTDKIHERVIIRVVNDPMTCERKTCSTGSKTYYVGTRSQAGGVQSMTYFTDASCTGTNITQQFLDGSYCGAAPFDPGTNGNVTIPNRLWLKYQITIGSGFGAGDKIVIAAKKQGTNDLKACAGRLGYSEFSMNNQFIECRQGSGTRTLIVKLVGQEEIKSWLAGSELLWGVRKATDTSTVGPTPDKSKGITVFTGRGSTGIVGNIKYSGEVEQFIEIPFTINL